MLRVTRVETGLPAAADAARVPRLRLTYEERAKCRLATVAADGTAVAILLPRGTVMRDGTVLAGDGGALAIVEAAPQPLTRITTDSPLALLRAVYHLANRHVPARLAPDHALIERDPVLERMLVALGANVEHIESPFDPEPGAFEGHAHGAGHPHREAIDEVSATVGEQLSIEAHRARRAP
jgi:urease accessory protein